jgi:hypothetical protein
MHEPARGATRSSPELIGRLGFAGSRIGSLPANSQTGDFFDGEFDADEVASRVL